MKWQGPLGLERRNQRLAADSSRETRQLRRRPLGIFGGGNPGQCFVREASCQFLILGAFRMSTVAIAHHDPDIVRRDVSAADIAVSIAFTEKWADLFILHGGPFDSFCSSSTANTCIRIEQPSYQCFKIPDNSIILQLYRIDGDHVCRPDGSDGFRSDAKKEGLMHGRGDEGGNGKGS